MEGSFDRFVSVEIVSDPLDPVYKVRYIERIEEKGVVRFERREGRVTKGDIEGLVSELVGKVRLDAR